MSDETPIPAPEPAIAPAPVESSFDIETPDIPLPDETGSLGAIADEKASAFKFAFIGSGQGGSRLAYTFWQLGYRRVGAINTAPQDLHALPLPEANKLCFGSGGAGKNPAAAAEVFAERKEDVLDFMRTVFGPVFDRIIVCAGAGGGTGAGTVTRLVECAAQLQEACKCPSKQVGVVLALPKISEGKKVNANAYWVLKDLADLVKQGAVSPLIVLDNERISSLYPGLAVNPFWNKANTSVCTLFDLFNTICVQNSSHTTFDPTDLKTILDSGLIVFGAMPVPKWQEPAALSSAMRDNLRRNILSGGVNLSTGSVAGAIIVAASSILETLPLEHLDQAFDQLTRLLRPGSTVHRGIYSGSKDMLAIYTAIGGLAAPDEKLSELKKLGDVLTAEKPGVGTVLGEH